jgi:hypothetical protein
VKGVTDLFLNRGADAMRQFIQRHAASTIGVLSGFDRVRFRGTLRWLASLQGLTSFLWNARVLLKDFKEYAQQITRRVTEASEHLAEATGRKVIYVPSPNVDKEQMIDRLQAECDEPVVGLIAVLSCVESCFTYFVHRSRERQKLELRGGDGRCLHHYFYLRDPDFGRMHIRLQTWFPFNVHIGINGREWLAGQLDKEGIGYRRRDNTFIAVDNVARAQELLDAQVRIDWPARLEALLRQVHPSHEQTFADLPIPYYWSAEQTEWASDVMFRSPGALAGVYPGLVRQAVQTFQSGDVLRFLGQKTTTKGQVSGNFRGEVTSDLATRLEGVRVKHRLGRNSLKMYDKQGSVLRIETTINDARGLKAWRPAEGDPEGARSWRRLRKGVADMVRLAELSQASNERYLEAQAGAASGTPLGQAAASLCRPVRKATLRARALNPLAEEDAALLESVARGEFAMSGFRNRDIRSLLHGAEPEEKTERKRQSAAVTRRLRLLVAHRLIRKVPHTHRYVLTSTGRRTLPALISARQADATRLAQLAG